MFCKVFTTGNDNYVYVNPNCNMKLIYEYLRVVADIPDNFEIDLCSDEGYLLGIFDAECNANGLKYLKPRANYYLFTFDYRDEKSDLFDPKPLMDYRNQDFQEVFGRIKMNFAIPKDHFIYDEDAELIFEHMLIAYEDKNDLDVVGDTSRGSLKSAPGMRKGSKKSIKSDTSCRVLQMWREEKRAKMATQLTITEEDEEVHSPIPRQNRMSSMYFPGLLPRLSTGEEADIQHRKPKIVESSTRRSKKAEKKKKEGKHSMKQDASSQKAAPPSSSKPNMMAESMISNSGTLVPSSSFNCSDACTAVKNVFVSHDSSPSDFPTVPTGENPMTKDRIKGTEKVKSNRLKILKKRSNKTK